MTAVDTTVDVIGTDTAYAAPPDLLRVQGMAHWPVPGRADEPPAVAGFVVSPFSPLVAHVAERCLRACFGRPPVPPADARTALVLVSRDGDVTTARTVAQAVDSGTQPAPLLFFQSVPNAVLGHVAARWGLTGPVVCSSPVQDPLQEGWEMAGLLIADDAADAVLLVHAELARSEAEQHCATAFLLRPKRDTGPRHPRNGEQA